MLIEIEIWEFRHLFDTYVVVTGKGYLYIYTNITNVVTW